MISFASTSLPPSMAWAASLRMDGSGGAAGGDWAAMLAAANRLTIIVPLAADPANRIASENQDHIVALGHLRRNPELSRKPPCERLASLGIKHHALVKHGRRIADGDPSPAA